MWAKTVSLRTETKVQAKLPHPIRSVTLLSLHPWEQSGVCCFRAFIPFLDNLRATYAVLNFSFTVGFLNANIFFLFFLFVQVEHAVLNPVICSLTTLEVEHAALNLSPVLYIDNPRSWTCCTEHFHQFLGNPRSWTFYLNLFTTPLTTLAVKYAVLNPFTIALTTQRLNMLFQTLSPCTSLNTLEVDYSVLNPVPVPWQP